MTDNTKNIFKDAKGNNRVVITGTGVISPVGKDTASFWESLTEGRHGISAIEIENADTYKVKLAAQVKNFEPMDYMDRKEARRMDRYCQFAVAASAEAVKSSGIDFSGMNPFDVGVIIGSGVGGLHTMQTQYEELLLKGGPDRVSPLFIPMMISNMASGRVSMIYGLKGANYCVTTACASGSHAIGEAFRLIKHGYLKAAVAGGAEAPITPIALGGFSGAGVVILESMENAVARGANILAEVAGYGATADAYHITSPDPQGLGAAEAMRIAMREAGVLPEEVSYINAHGTGTDLNDRYETIAIKSALGDAAYTTKISSTKSVTGHLLGAAGGVEAIACALAMKNGVIPPTIGLTTPDPECDLDYTPNVKKSADLKISLSNSLGFGGQNATLLFKKAEV
jgi:3-oxoacyl-[acyl-carrier-protein] synthase II